VVAIIAIFPFIIVLSFCFTVILTAKAIVHEKETGLKEAMKLMGMKSWVYWLSWYIKTFIILLPSMIFMILSYKINLPLKDGGRAAIIDKTDPLIFALFLLLQTSSLITFIFLCTTFFKKSNSAAAGAGIIYFLSYLPYIFISLRYEQMNFASKLMSCFVNNLAMCLGIQLIGMFEGKGEGINFSNWTKGINYGDDFSIAHVMLIMFINNFIHLSLTYYFSNLFPGNHGIAKPWYFPFIKLVKKFKPNKQNKIKDKVFEMKSNNVNEEIHSQVFIEDESIYLKRKIGVRIDNIVKIFKQLGKIKTAVKNLSLNIYEGQISVLLGLNHIFFVFYLLKFN